MHSNLTISCYGDRAAKIGSAVFCVLLFSGGYWMFRHLAHGRLDWFWTVRLGGTGSIALLTLISRQAVVTQQALHYSYALCGVLPLYRRTVLTRSAFRGVARQCLKATGYDDDEPRLYRPRIMLISHGGEEWLLQQFSDGAEQNPGRVLAAATRLAKELGLPLSHRVESW